MTDPKVRERNRAIIIFALFCGKFLVINSARFFYTFQPVFKDVYDVSYTELGAVLSVMEIVGLSSPIASWMVNRYSCERVMILSVIFSGIFTFITPFMTNIAYLFLCRTLFGFAKAFMITSSQIFLEFIPPHQRARIIGAIELSYGLTSLIGIPLMGLILDSLGWQYTFYLNGGLCLPAAMAMAYFLRGDRETWTDVGLIVQDENDNQEVDDKLRIQIEQSKSGASVKHNETYCSVFNMLFSCFNPNGIDKSILLRSWGVFVSILGGVLGIQIFYTNYPVWLETEYNLTQSRIAKLTFVLGLAEIAGEGTIALIGNKVSLTNTLFYSSWLFVLASIAIIGLTQIGTLVATLLGLCICIYCFELTVLCNFALLPSIFPPAPDLYAGLFIWMVTGGFAFGAILAPLAWTWSNNTIYVSAGISCGFLLLAGVGAGMVYYADYYENNNSKNNETNNLIEVIPLEKEILIRKT